MSGEYLLEGGHLDIAEKYNISRDIYSMFNVEKNVYATNKY